MSEACCGQSGACDPKEQKTGGAPGEHDGHAHSAPSAALSGRQTATVAASGLLIAAGAVAAYLGNPGSAVGFYATSIALSIPQPLRRAWRAIGERSLDINALMVIAVVGAVLLDDWMEAAAVVWLFGIAQWLETLSMVRARRAVRSLMTDTPTTAIVRRAGRDETVPVAQVQVGEVVVIRPGDRVPVDGVVVTGATAINQAPVTGESVPVEKTIGDAVFAGSINGNSAIEVETTRPASDSTIARIVHLVEAAQSQRAPVQTFVERFARRYTPAVVALAVAMVVIGPLATGGVAGWSGEFTTWSYRALALLVVACPCALVISTPVSFVSALTSAARNGVLIKGGAHLERLSGVKAIAFDKTGTLTQGRVMVTDVLAVEGVSAHGVLSVAAALELRSEHPIGRAIVDRAHAIGLAVLPGDGFRALPGLGAEALVAMSPAIVGSHRLFEERQLCTPSLHAHASDVEERGGTPVLVGHGGSALGVIRVSDQMRGEGRNAITRLRDEGIARVELLTGDTPANAEAIRASAGLDAAHAGLMPADKVRHIARLRAEFGSVAMVGDGVNDAPALAAADVGIAMGTAGSDIALETADVALMSDELEKLPYALRLARATMTNIRTNLILALGLKLAFVVAAAAGVATLWMAVLADTGASLLVTANSLRLLRTR